MSSSLHAADHQNAFDEGSTSCRAYFDPKKVELKLHERTETLSYAGRGSERFQFVTAEDNLQIIVECPIPPARVFEELRATMAVYANRPGTQIAARVVFPHQIDPKTNEPVSRLILGETLEDASKWQQLTCSTPDDVVARHLILWRASLQPQELDPREMYIDRIYLRQIISRGMTELIIDELRVAPVVSPDGLLLGNDSGVGDGNVGPEVEFQLGQLRVNNRPMFPVMVPYQGESLDLLQQLGANVVWIDNYLDRKMIDDLRSKQMWATAWPPRVAAQGTSLAEQQTKMPQFGSETAGIAFWNLGVRIPESRHKLLQEWVHQVKSSDRTLRRPVLADVAGLETAFSRDVDLLGVSQHVLMTPDRLDDFSKHLEQRSRLAQPGTFMTSWIQTEAPIEVARMREQEGQAPLVVEPEQIRLQTYLALCSGCRGLGFWTWKSLEAEGPGYEERRLVLEQLGTELRMLEPFLSTGEVIDRFKVPLTATSRSASRSPGVGASSNSSNETVDAALVRSGHGLLILLAASEKTSQYVPGPLATSDLKILVRSLPESAFLWQITPTGLWPLETIRKAGGTEIRIPRFNMTTALMAATDQVVAQNMEAEIFKTQARAAELSRKLAAEKLERVSRVDKELTALGVGLPSGQQLLAQSRRLLDDSDRAWESRQYHQARENAEASGQLLRILQRLHWTNCIRHASHPTASPHTVTFQSLPDHWRLVQALGKDAVEVPTEGIRKIHFEDANAMRIEGWTRDVTTAEQIAVYDALDPGEVHEGEYSLRMVSVPSGESTMIPPDVKSIRYESPKVAVHPGELLHVTGWVRVARPIQHSSRGFRIYDTHYGPSMALKWDTAGDWKPFEMLRPISKQEELQIVLELNGLGDVAVDDFQIRRLRLPQPAVAIAPPALGPENPDAKPLSPTNRAIDVLKGLLK